jgi:hypothetical protein
MTRQRGKERKIRSAILMFFLIFISIFFELSAYAQEQYSKITELECENAKIQIKSECLTGNILPFSSKIYPYCISQEILFTNINTKQVIKRNASGILTKESYGGKRLNALAVSAACIKGSSDNYLIINYYNGGNCSCCEWDEIINLQGSLLASNGCGENDSKNIKADEWDRIKQLNSQKFDKVYKKLGLPISWPKSLFIEINLKPNK